MTTMLSEKAMSTRVIAEGACRASCMKLEQHHQLQLYTSKAVGELDKLIMVESLPSAANEAGQQAVWCSNWNQGHQA